MKKLIILTSTVFLICISIGSFGAKISPFRTDGCSAYPDGIPGIDSRRWHHCCLAHDLSYWMGGPVEEKRKADNELNQCVSDASTSWHGSVMEWGVYLGGIPNTYFGWRWGYGFEESRSYDGLTEIEAEDALVKLDELIYHLQDNRDTLSTYQKGYVIGRFSFLRRLLQEKAGVDPFSEEKASEERLRYDILLDLLRE